MSVKSCFNCRKVLSVLVFMLMFQVAGAQLDFSGLDKKLVAAKGDVGKNYVCLVFKDGKIVYKKEQEGFDMKTPAPIGLASTWLTAALVMTFVDQGKISLDEKVGTYLPIFNLYSKKYITIRHCLSSLTGLRSEEGIAKLAERNKYPTLEAEVNAFANTRDIENNPGVDFKFNNIGIDITARICEIVGKRGFEQLINEKLLRPLNMRNTSFFNNGGIAPSNGAVSSAGDYINFLNMLLNKGMFNGKRVLSEASVEEMMKPQTTLSIIKYAPKPVQGFNYATGCWVQEADANGKSTTLSCPAMNGTWPWIDLCRNYAAVVLTQSGNGESNKTVFLGLKAFIDGVVGECGK